MTLLQGLNGTCKGSEVYLVHSIQEMLAAGTSLLAQWLRLWAPNAGGPGSIPGQGTRSPILQLRPGAAK